VPPRLEEAAAQEEGQEQALDKGIFLRGIATMWSSKPMSCLVSHACDDGGVVWKDM